MSGVRGSVAGGQSMLVDVPLPARYCVRSVSAVAAATAARQRGYYLHVPFEML